jgi:Cys-rich protein (TIGR01571 family)
MSKFQEDLFACFATFKPACISIIPGGICYLQAAAIDKIYNQGKTIPFLCVLSFLCFGGAMNRSKLRERFGIQGSYLTDTLIWFLAPLCASVQEYKEVYVRH